MNLLIVDDEIIAARGMREGIDWPGCGIDGEVFMAHDSLGAQQLLAANPVDIILCDIEMPGENGIALIRRVRAENPDIVCIFLTCHAKFEYAQEALRLGCKDYILTPAPYSAIAGKVREATEELERGRQAHKLQEYGGSWLRQQQKSAEGSQGDKRSTGEIVADTCAYILANLASDTLSVPGLAARCYLNEDYLNRVFKRHRGLSLNQYIIQQRMELAARLLQSETLSVSTIAAQVGYSNYPYFVSAFKRFYGITPTQYRKNSSQDTKYPRVYRFSVQRSQN